MSTAVSSPLRALVLGAGSFGTCLAQHMACLGHQTRIWAREKRVCDGINLRHRNPSYLNSIPLHPSLEAFSELTLTDVAEVDMLVLVIPTQFMREVIQKIPAEVLKDTRVVCAAKGLEVAQKVFPLDIIEQVWGKQVADRAVMLSGPSFAVEVACHQPTAVTAASKDEASLNAVQQALHASFFRVYASDDPYGLEVAGALKNVIAIAAGASRGLGFEQNSLAALLTRGLAEMVRFGQAKGAHPLTFQGLSGVGDLFLTCTSEKSRNYTVGYRLGKGEVIEHILDSMTSVAEGVATAKPAYELSQELNVRMPIVTAVYRVLYEEAPITEVVQGLMSSLPRHERD